VAAFLDDCRVSLADVEEVDLELLGSQGARE